MRAAPLKEYQVLYTDDAIAVVVKPAGMPTQPDPTGDCDLLTSLKREFGDLWLVHRLDRAVGGVMVFARSAHAAGVLSSAVAAHDVFGKSYVAIVAGTLTGEETLTDLLFHDTRARRAFVVDRRRNGVKEAILTRRAVVTRETSLGVSTLADITLMTGRFHQIRVQFASRKTPILGDGKYGSRVKCPLALFAYRLTFPHPISGQKLTFTAAPPDGAPWQFFTADLLSLIK